MTRLLKLDLADELLRRRELRAHGLVLRLDLQHALEVRDCELRAERLQVARRAPVVRLRTGGMDASVIGGTLRASRRAPSRTSGRWLRLGLRGEQGSVGCIDG